MILTSSQLSDSFSYHSYHSGQLLPGRNTSSGFFLVFFGVCSKYLPSISAMYRKQTHCFAILLSLKTLTSGNKISEQCILNDYSPYQSNPNTSMWSHLIKKQRPCDTMVASGAQSSPSPNCVTHLLTHRFQLQIL